MITEGSESLASMDTQPHVEWVPEREREKLAPVFSNEGLTIEGRLGGGYYSNVYLVKNQDGKEMAAKTAKHDNFRDASLSISLEYELLTKLQDAQIKAGIAPDKLYTPKPLKLIRAENEQILLMDVAKGESFVDYLENHGALGPEKTLKAAIKIAHLFLILEKNDPTESHHISMGRDFQLRNIFATPPEGQPNSEDVKVIDWSLSVNDSQLSDARMNERFAIAQILLRGIIGKGDVEIKKPSKEVSEKRTRDIRKAILYLKGLESNSLWQDLDPEVKYVIMKGLGYTEEFPQGYNSHAELMTDLLKLAKRCSLKPDQIPSQLSGEFDSVDTSELGKKLTLKEAPDLEPLKNVLAFRLWLILKFPNLILNQTPDKEISRVVEMGYEENDIIDFLSKAEHGNFTNYGTEEAKKQTLLARIMTADYNLYKKILANNGTRDEYLDMRQSLFEPFSADLLNNKLKTEDLNKLFAAFTAIK